jgi:hypothetical protein
MPKLLMTGRRAAMTMSVTCRSAGDTEECRQGGAKNIRFADLPHGEAAVGFTAPISRTGRHE